MGAAEAMGASEKDIVIDIDVLFIYKNVDVFNYLYMKTIKPKMYCKSY